MLYTALYLLLITPSCYNRLQPELDTAFNTGKISIPLTRDTKARDLPYLQAVLCEGLRLFPR
jgi:cytochrome P450